MPQPIVISPPATKSNLTPLYIGAGLVGAYFAYKKISAIYAEYKAKTSLNKDQGTDVTATPQKKLLDLNGKPVQKVNLALIATDVYNALHPGWYKPTEQDRAVRAFKNTPFGYVKELEKIYLDKYGENLKETLADKLSDVNFIKIKFFF